MHEIGASGPPRDAHIAVVDKLIDQLAKPGTPVLRCYNKVDMLDDMSNFPIGEKNIPMCARNGIGMDELLTRIEQTLLGTLHHVTLLLPYTEGGAIEVFHEQAQVHRVEYLPEGIEIELTCKDELYGRYRRYERETS